MHTEVDHAVPIADGCDPWDTGNWQAAHKSCNASKGAGMGTRAPLVHTRTW